MDRELQQQNGNVHDELDLTIPSDDKDSFWNNLAVVDEDNDNDNDDDDDDDDDGDEDYTGVSSSNRRRRKASKRAKRHSREQIQRLEAVFDECSHPSDNMRLDLAKKLGMGALQVKFWFQNRRSAKKNQLEKHETKVLREENKALKAEQQAIKAALLKKTCPTCGGPVVHREETLETKRLTLENARLKDEIFHQTSLLNKVYGKSSMPMVSGYGQLAIDLNIDIPDNSLMMDPVIPQHPHHVLMDATVQGCVHGSCTSITRANTQHTALLGRVLSAYEEFMVMAKKDDTMWLPTLDGEVLDYQRYHDVTFPGIFGLCLPGYAMNCTKDTNIVVGTGADIINILTDTTGLCEAFPGIVGSVTNENIAPPTGHDGLVQLNLDLQNFFYKMNVDLLVLSPRMPTCKVVFVRQSRQMEPNVWAVVDVSVDDICGQDGTSGSNTWINAGVPMACRLRPSGCLIEDMNNGYCKVTWIVNAEYDMTAAPELYHPLLRSGHALGARRWLTSLRRRCQCLALLRSESATYVGKTMSPVPSEGRNRVMELSQQMTVSFCAALCGAGPRGGQAWGSVEECRKTSGVGAESFQVGMRVATLRTAGNALGAQAGLTISAATTVWLPGTPAKHVFDYLCDSKRRGEWDTFSNGAPVQQDHVAAIQSPHYAVTVLRPMAAHGTNSKKLILQQACGDDSCMMVAYAQAEEQSLQGVMRGGSPAVLSLLPSGFVILPDGHGDEHIPPVDTKRPSGSATSHRTSDGCLVSALFQTFLSGPTPENLIGQTIDNVGNLLSRSIVKIKDAVRASVVVTA